MYWIVAGNVLQPASLPSTSSSSVLDANVAVSIGCYWCRRCCVVFDSVGLECIGCCRKRVAQLPPPPSLPGRLRYCRRYGIAAVCSWYRIDTAVGIGVYPVGFGCCGLPWLGSVWCGFIFFGLSLDWLELYRMVLMQETGELNINVKLTK